jgi:hypothetical protein
MASKTRPTWLGSCLDCSPLERINLPRNVSLNICISGLRQVVNIVHGRFTPLKEFSATNLPLRVANGG